LKELWVPLSAAIAKQRQVETIANIVANANTTAFKRDQLAFKEHLTAQTKGADIDLPNKEWSPEDFYKSYGAERAFVKVDGSYTDFEQGQIRPTNNPFDFAINGKGFIEVLTPNGIRYTRNGSLSVSSEGELVTKQGYKVLSKLNVPPNATEQQLRELPAPATRTINIGNGPITINHKGEIFQNNQLLAEINLVGFKDTDELKKEGHSLFINDRADNLLAESKSLIIQGSLETSNVNPIKEMSELIKAQRSFDSIQKAIKTYDSMASKAYNEIGKF
jgi:flagellar basal-body rod protein FlgG